MRTKRFESPVKRVPSVQPNNDLAFAVSCDSTVKRNKQHDFHHIHGVVKGRFRASLARFALNFDRFDVLSLISRRPIIVNSLIDLFDFCLVVFLQP